MNSKLSKFKNQYLDYKMLRWGAVGLLTNVIDYCLFISLYHPLKSVFIANLISSLVSTSINYFTHHIWTFKSNQTYSKSGVKYLINLVFWWVVATSIIKVLVVLQVDPKIAKLVPLVVIVPINYFILNHVVFKKKTKRP